MEEKKTLSLESYKGTRDFYPEDMAVRNYLFGVMRTTVQKYGYVEYDASIIEETDLYRAKSGEEIVNEQTYTFQDRGGRDVTIRPEMTPTVARMIAKKRKELVFPLRWYSIPNLLRYERPQRGRLREHWQLNVDMFGDESPAADAEVIAVAYAIMRAYGANESDFRVLVNHRGISTYLLRNYLGADEATAYRLSKLIDRKKKMTNDEFEAQAIELLADRAERFIRFLSIVSLDELPEEFQKIEPVIVLRTVMEKLGEYGIRNAAYDPTVMRGFDYYTGAVFEVFDTHPLNNRSLFGGGRYDDLVGLFGVEKVSGVGFGMGDVTIRDFLETRDLVPQIPSTADLYLCVLDPSCEKDACMFAEALRGKGVSVAVDHTGRKIAAQIKTAERQHISHLICFGEEEARSHRYKLKDLANREEREVGEDEAVAHILSTNGQER